MKKTLYILSLATLVFSCSPQEIDNAESQFITADAKGLKASNQGNNQEKLDPPGISCGTATSTTLEIVVTAGAKGAAGGFDIHWMTEADFLAIGSNWDDELACEAGFSGNGNEAYNLAPGASLSLNLEDLVAASECGIVECGVTYVFRVRAKTEGGQGNQGGLKKSDWSETFSCATTPCTEICLYGLGHWKNHSSDNPGKQEDLWKVTSLKLGTVTYDLNQLNTIYDANNSMGNGIVIFAQHLITAKLNVANGAEILDLNAVIAAGDLLIGDLSILEDSFSDDQKKISKKLKEKLDPIYASNSCD